MSKITFYIARHGKTLMNTLDMVQGWCDSPLTEEGIAVAKHLGLGLQHIQLDAAYCSTLRRTRQTAEIVLNAMGQSHVSLTEKDGFKEACFGSFEGSSNKQMWGNTALYLHYKSYDDLAADIFAGKLHYDVVLDAIKELDTLGMAENMEILEKRTQMALKEAAQEVSKKGGKNVLVIAHGMSILGLLLNLGGRELLKSPLENASVCKVIYENDKFSVESMGDLSYVENGRKHG